MLPRTHLIRLQRALYDKLKVGARTTLGGLSPELQRYFREYQQDFKSYERPTTKRELLMEVLASQVVFCGDYHTLSQAQRTVIRILRDTIKILKRKKRSLVLALEMLSEEDLPSVRKFLQGKLSEQRFLAKTRFRERWGFQWENYRELFLFAKEEGVSIIALGRHNLNAPLKVRDKYASRILAEMTKEDPDALIFSLMGDLHLAQKHLPSDFKAELKKKRLDRSVLVIHQNHEQFYWELVEQGMEQFVEVIRMKPRVYCVMNATPWVKLQSHLKWIETLSEGSPGKNALSDYARAIDLLDHSHEVTSMISILRDFFEISDPIPEDFRIRGPLDLSFLERVQENKTYTRMQQKILSREMGEFESIFFPKEDILFLTNLSINHIAVQTAYYMHSTLSHFSGIFERPGVDFYTFVWIEALAFLCSKVVNPKRQCHGMIDLRRKLRSYRKKKLGKSTNAKATQFALVHLEVERKRMYGRKGKLGLRIPKETSSIETILAYHKAAKILGALLGHGIYSALMENRVEKDEVRALFYCPFTQKHNPLKLYLQWTERLEPYRFREIVKREKM